MYKNRLSRRFTQDPTPLSTPSQWTGLLPVAVLLDCVFVDERLLEDVQEDGEVALWDFTLVFLTPPFLFSLPDSYCSDGVEVALKNFTKVTSGRLTTSSSSHNSIKSSSDPNNLPHSCPGSG